MIELQLDSRLSSARREGPLLSVPHHPRPRGGPVCLDGFASSLPAGADQCFTFALSGIPLGMCSLLRETFI